MDNADQGDEENTDEINVEADGEENMDGTDDEQNLPGQVVAWNLLKTKLLQGVPKNAPSGHMKN